MTEPSSNVDLKDTERLQTTNICGLLGLKVQPDPPENWIAQEKDPLAGPDEVRVEGAIDREAGTQTAWPSGFL